MKDLSNYNILMRGEHKNWFVKYAYKTKSAFYRKLADLGQVNIDGEWVGIRHFSHNGKEYKVEILGDFDEQ